MHPLIAIPGTLALVIRAYTRNSLTIPGILLATLTATIHALHPSPLPFTLLVLFFLLGTTATKVKHDIKANLTLSSSGSAGGEGPRTSIQVLANSGVASLLCLIHVWKHGYGSRSHACFGSGGARDLVMLGVIANYAAVTADTLSSELGILSKSRPRLITTLRSVPPGTNGGVTLAGVLAGAGGSAVIGLVTVLLLDFCDATSMNRSWTRLSFIRSQQYTTWDFGEKIGFWLAITAWGMFGSLLDSLLGALLQASVIDRRTGKVVEGTGGRKVLVVSRRPSVDETEKTKKEVSRSIGSGRDILDNNQINLLMALSMSIGGIIIGGSMMGLEIRSIFS